MTLKEKEQELRAMMDDRLNNQYFITDKPAGRYVHIADSIIPELLEHIRELESKQGE